MTLRFTHTKQRGANIKDAVSLHFEDQLQSGEDIRVLSISEFEVHPVAKASSS
jgi:hypothetical protein